MKSCRAQDLGGMCGRFQASRGLACTELSLEVGKRRLDSHGPVRAQALDAGWSLGMHLTLRL